MTSAAATTIQAFIPETFQRVALIDAEHASCRNDEAAPRLHFMVNGKPSQTIHAEPAIPQLCATYSTALSDSDNALKRPQFPTDTLPCHRRTLPPFR